MKSEKIFSLSDNKKDKMILIFTFYFRSLKKYDPNHSVPGTFGQHCEEGCRWEFLAFCYITIGKLLLKREGLMLKKKFQCFGHLMQRTNSLGKILTLGKNEGRRRRRRQDEMVGWPSATQWTWVWANSQR